MDFFFKLIFSQQSVKNTFRESNSLDPDQTWHFDQASHSCSIWHFNLILLLLLFSNSFHVFIIIYIFITFLLLLFSNSFHVNCLLGGQNMLTFHVNCLPSRQFTWNVNTYFLRKKPSKLLSKIMKKKRDFKMSSAEHVWPCCWPQLKRVCMVLRVDAEDYVHPLDNRSI